jgi:ferritin
MTAKLNEQITNEFNASQIYLAMACMFESLSLKLLAGWFRAQTEEERGHALKILNYILSQQGTVELGAIPKPAIEYPSVPAAIEAAVKHEIKVTGQINDLVALAEKEKDYATRSFLQWFVNEQVEEVDSVSHLHEIAKMASKNLLQLEAYVAHLGRGKS